MTHIDLLTNALQSRRDKNPSYSLRAFAKHLDISPSLLSNLLRGSKGISEQKAAQMAKKLQLSKDLSKIFVLSAVGAHDRSATKRKDAAQELAKLQTRKANTKVISESEMNILRSWHYLTLLELLELPECEHSVTWLARKLGLTTMATDKMIDQLLSLKMIQYTDEKYSSVYGETQSEFDTQSEATVDFHRSILAEAQKAIKRDEITKREYISMTLAFDIAKMEEAKESIRDFQEKFAAKFYDKDGDNNSVYQLSMQFFRTDQTIG